MIKFDIGYNNRSKTWHLLASRGDIGYGMGWLGCRPTQKQVRKFKQCAHEALKPYSHGGEA